MALLVLLSAKRYVYTIILDVDSNYKLIHLVRPTEHGSSDQQDKMVTEIYLTRQVLVCILCVYQIFCSLMDEMYGEGVII